MAFGILACWRWHYLHRYKTMLAMAVSQPTLSPILCAIISNTLRQSVTDGPPHATVHLESADLRHVMLTTEGVKNRLPPSLPCVLVCRLHDVRQHRGQRRKKAISRSVRIDSVIRALLMQHRVSHLKIAHQSPDSSCRYSVRSLEGRADRCRQVREEVSVNVAVSYRLLARSARALTNPDTDGQCVRLGRKSGIVHEDSRWTPGS
jgi:hypothetical protein